MNDNMNDPVSQKVDVGKLKKKIEIHKCGKCPMCLAEAATVEYKGIRICESCYNKLTIEQTDSYFNVMQQNNIHTIDLCWDMLKSQLKSKQYSKDDIYRLKDAMKNLLENLVIGV